MLVYTPPRPKRTEPRGFRRQMTCACSIAAFAFGAQARASELTISRDAVQALVIATIFKDQGKWYIAKGTCYAFLERPRTALIGGRLVLNGHLSSRVGVEVGDSCLGTDLASDVQLSGRFIAAGSQITLNDIRIDKVKDDPTRQLLELLQSAAGASLPRAFNIDLLQLLQPTIVPGTAVTVAVTGLEISAVTTQADRVNVNFEMKLNAH